MNLRVPYVLALHAFPVSFLNLALGPPSAVIEFFQSLGPHVIFAKYLPLCWSLPLLTLLPKYVRGGAAFIHLVVALVGISSVWRWTHYYFLSAGNNTWFGVMTNNIFPEDAFPTCNSACGFSQLYEDTFSATAYGTHAMCTWDAISVIIVSALHIAIDGSRAFAGASTFIYFLANLVLGPEVVYPVFLIHLASVQARVHEKMAMRRPSQIEQAGHGNFWLYTAMVVLSFLPMLYAVHKRNIVDQRDVRLLTDDMMSNPSAVRGMVIVMVTPFSQLAYFLPDYGEETDDRAASTASVWFKKFVLWNAYLSHVGAAQAGVLALAELDLGIIRRSVSRGKKAQ